LFLQFYKYIYCTHCSDRVGGRTLTVPLNSKDGTDMWDLGGQWIGQ